MPRITVVMSRQSFGYCECHCPIHSCQSNGWQGEGSKRCIQWSDETLILCDSKTSSWFLAKQWKFFLNIVAKLWKSSWFKQKEMREVISSVYSIDCLNHSDWIKVKLRLHSFFSTWTGSWVLFGELTDARFFKWTNFLVFTQFQGIFKRSSRLTNHFMNRSNAPSEEVEILSPADKRLHKNLLMPPYWVRVIYLGVDKDFSGLW